MDAASQKESTYQLFSFCARSGLDVKPRAHELDAARSSGAAQRGMATARGHWPLPSRKLTSARSPRRRTIRGSAGQSRHCSSIRASPGIATATASNQACISPSQASTSDPKLVTVGRGRRVEGLSKAVEALVHGHLQRGTTTPCLLRRPSRWQFCRPWRGARAS